MKRGAWAAPASSWAFSPFFSHSPPWFNGRSNKTGRGWGGTGRHKAGAPGGAANRGGFSLFAGGKGAEAGFPGATAKGFLSPSLFFPLSPPTPPTQPGRAPGLSPVAVSLSGRGCVPGGRASGRAPCRGEGLARRCRGLPSRPLTNTNAGIKGQRRRRRRSRLARGRREAVRDTQAHGDRHTHTHTPRRAGTPRTHGHTHARAEQRGRCPRSPPQPRRGAGGGCAAPVLRPLLIRSIKEINKCTYRKEGGWWSGEGGDVWVSTIRTAIPSFLVGNKIRTTTLF